MIFGDTIYSILMNHLTNMYNFLIFQIKFHIKLYKRQQLNDINISQYKLF